MNKRLALLPILSFAALAGCTTDVGGGAPDPSSGVGGDEDVAPTSQAMTLLNYCATGTSANAVGTLYTAGVWDSFIHNWQNKVPGVCGSAPRETTIVDYNVSAVNVTYRFETSISFWTVTDPARCAQTQAALRLQRLQGGTWVEDSGDYIVDNGTWISDYSEPNFGHCSLPVTYKDKFNWSSNSTTKYRVRTWARQWDGSPATVTVRARRNSS